MYTGRIIEDLIETVARAEEHADALEQDVPVYAQSRVPEFGYNDELLGVA